MNNEKPRGSGGKCGPPIMRNARAGPKAQSAPADTMHQAMQ